MKRLTIALLLLLHTAASSGTVLSIHYCMGTFASLHLGHKEGRGCAKCGMKNSGCCHDDVKIVKIDNAQYLTNQSAPVTFSNHLFLSFPSATYSFDTFHNENHFIAPSYLLSEGPPIFILNCNFRI